MNCIICKSKATYYFSKQYREFPFDEFMHEIGPVEYYKCTECGFVLSKTHAELNCKTWQTLNDRFHHHIENPSVKNNINQPPYAEQALMISLLKKNGIINTDSILDFAAGYGTLSTILKKYYNDTLPIYDPFVSDNTGSNVYVETLNSAKYKTVINSAMFEHVRTRDDLDSVNALVDFDGCLILHTVICENIPKDPEWFYLRPPVHTAFHTNKSMNVLMKQWGYNCSTYCPQSKCWILFKSKNHISTIEAINTELKNVWFISNNDGFVDYWKGF